ncbi:DUF4893 domain-containing protein [Devosia sp. CAU 1758]
MLLISQFRRLTVLTAALAMLPMVMPLACEVPSDASITQFDGDRMTGFDAARTRGIGEALLADNAEERAIVAGLFAPGNMPISAIPDGPYRCRTIKLGGLLPLVSYPFFDCAISHNGKVIEKLSGSQRFKGQLLPTNDAIFYWGALHYGDERPFAYEADAERSQVGCLYKVDGKPVRYRLELPFPRFESTHDVIELVPAR